MTAYDSQKIRDLVEEAGGTVVVAYEADIGQSTLTKMISGTYFSRPSKKLRSKFAKYFNVSEESLFPAVGSKKRRAS